PALPHSGYIRAADVGLPGRSRPPAWPATCLDDLRGARMGALTSADGARGMAVYRGTPVRTAFGRPRSARAGDASGLAWLFLLLMIGGVFMIRAVTQVAQTETPSASGLARFFGEGT